MIIIGERINTSIKSTQAAVENSDFSAIQDIAKKQIENGANYLDINCGTFVNNEEEKISWLIDEVYKVSDIPLCIDSPNPKAIEIALKKNKGTNPIINSITFEKERWNQILPLVINYNTSVIALCIDDSGIPQTALERIRIAEKIANEMDKVGIRQDRIFFDPLVQPISTNTDNGKVTLEVINVIRKEFPKCHITCGLSNISFGLPERKLLNQAFVTLAIYNGLDCAIVDPMDKKLLSLIYAANAIAGQDEYCMDYITKYREGFFSQDLGLTK